MNIQYTSQLQYLILETVSEYIHVHANTLSCMTHVYFARGTNWAPLHSSVLPRLCRHSGRLCLYRGRHSGRYTFPQFDCTMHIAHELRFELEPLEPNTLSAGTLTTELPTEFARMVQKNYTVYMIDSKLYSYEGLQFFWGEHWQTEWTLTRTGSDMHWKLLL